MVKLDPFFPDIDRLAQQLCGPAVGGARTWGAVDAWRDGDTFVVEVDIPGVDEDSLDVSVDHDTLTVRAERPEPADDRTWLVSERPHGAVSRQLALGTTVETDKITADYADGVLRLRIPVAEKAKPRKIAVVAGKQRQAIDA